MYDSNPSPLDPSKLIIVLVIAIVCVMGITFALNGTTSTEPVENNTTEEQKVQTPTIHDTIVGNSTLGTVTKKSGYGNTSSNIRIALIVGVNQKVQGDTAVISTLENSNDLKYAYDIYVIKITNDTKNGDTSNYSSNLTLNNKTQSLAYEYVVPDIINNQYNFTMDIHGVTDSNSFVFVPSEDTFTSANVVSNISNNTNVGRYTPSSYSYASYVSLPLISNNIPSMVYMTNAYYSDGVSDEISEVMHAVDDFDFEHLMEDINNNSSDNQDDSSSQDYNDSSNDSNDSDSQNSSSSYKNSNSATNSTSTNNGNSEIID